MVGLKTVAFFCLAALSVMLMDGQAVRGQDEGAEVSAFEVTEHPALLVSAKTKVEELTVYGVRLGDSIEKIPQKAGAAKRQSDTNPAITFCVGPDVAYVAYEGKIVKIVVGGNFALKLPPQDMASLQMALGKADQIEPENETDHMTYLTFLARHLKIDILETHLLRGRVTAVSIYAL